MAVTVRGMCRVDWRPAYTLTLTSTNGSTLPADGRGNEMVATLTRTSNGAAIANKRILLTTYSSGRAGDGARGTTDAQGKFRFQISNTLSEPVWYFGRMLRSRGTSSAIRVTREVTAETMVRWERPNDPVTISGVGGIEVTEYADDDALTLRGYGYTVSWNYTNSLGTFPLKRWAFKAWSHSGGAFGQYWFDCSQLATDNATSSFYSDSGAPLTQGQCGAGGEASGVQAAMEAERAAIVAALG